MNILPKEIDKAREALWRKHQGTNTISASLFNFIIYTKTNARTEYLEKIARNVIRKFPCRVILITEVEGSESYLKTSVTDLQPDNGAGSLFCDMIHFEVSGAHRERIPFVIIPNLLADLPVFLLWGEDPTKEDPIARALEALSTRAIFDSECASSLSSFAKALLAMHDCDIGDLNWARLAPWRALFGQFFNAPEKLQCIVQATELRITYNTVETKTFCHHQIQATYFSAWIAQKLGWKKGQVQVTLTPGKDDQILPGRILSLEITAPDSHLSFKQNHPHITIYHSTSTNCEMPAQYLLDKEIAGKSMIHEIYSQGTQESFIQVLKSLCDAS